MSESTFHPLKDFHLYEVGPNGDVRKRTTKRPLTPMRTKSGERFALYDSGHCLTISRSKLRYCYRNGTSPYELRGKVISDGELTDIANHCNRLRLMNEEIHRLAKADTEDLIAQYERGERFLSLMIKMLRKELSEEEGEELQGMVKSCIRKGLVRYYRDKKEYRKEEIDDIAKEVFYGTFLSHCPLNIDCYVYEIVKRKLGNKK
ncbi:MAG: hypothetical protein IJA95_06965 [Bacteroidaceae bacterium]|nr:hypothetical protein [Bacteroidaceae bacterium]